MDSFSFAQIMTRVINTPLLAHPRKGAIFYNILAERGGGVTINLPATPDAAVVDALSARRGSPKASRFAGAPPRLETGGLAPYMLTNRGVGVISITGAMINRGAWIGSNSGQTSYEGIREQVSRAAEDGRVKSIILDLHTPGGEATGAFETSAIVAKAAKLKPVIAVVNGMAASGGYALASAATKIVTTPSGFSGSVGVLLMHVDYSENLAQDGIKPTLIFTPVHKADGNSLEPLTSDVKAELQSEVNSIYELFIGSIEAGRGKRFANAARASEGRAFMGQQALDAKIVDEMGTFEEVLADLGRKPSRQSAASRESTAKMSNQEDDDIIARSDSNRAVAAADSSGYARGRAEATARFAAIMGHSKVAGHETFALKLAAEAPEMSVESVVKMVEALPPAATATAARSVAERAGETGAQAVSGLPTAGEQQPGGQMSGIMRKVAEDRAAVALSRNGSRAR